MKINIENKFLRIFFILQWILATGIIYYFSSQSKIEFLPSKIWDYDKIIHFIVFLVYGFSSILLIIGLNSKMKLNKAILLSIAIGLAFGAFDEIHQSYTPGRDSNIYDFFADLVGILVSASVTKIILKHHFKFKYGN